MGRSIVEQPDGKYALFSTIVDDFIVCDLTEEELIEFCAQEAYDREKESLVTAFALRKEQKNAPGFWCSWEEANKQINEIHGKVYRR